MKTIQQQDLSSFFIYIIFLIMVILAVLMLPVVREALDQLNHFLIDGIGAVKSGMNRSYGFQ